MLFLVLLVPGFVVRLPVGPKPPEDLQPPLAQAAQRAGVVVALLAFAGVIRPGPRAFFSAVVGPQMHRVAQHHVARPADARSVDLPALVADRADPGLTAQRVGVGIDLAHRAHFAQQSGCQLLAGPGQRAKDFVIGVLGEGLGDAPAVFLELGLEGLEHF